MIGNTTQLIIAQGGTGTGAGSGQQSTVPWAMNVLPFVLLIFVFYFLLIRPQQKKQKDHDNLLKTLRSGDKVVTSSGIVGTIVSVKDKSVSLRSADTKLEVLKSAVSEITERANEPSQP